jgi:prophage antirepressor-like protein
MSNISVFNNPAFGDVRVITKNNEPWFCLKDVCESLALQPKHVKSRLSDEVVTTDHIFDSLGRQQVVNFINEDGLYDVILDSRKPEAKAFRKWVTSEVLPSIRKHGMYMTNNVVESIMTDPDKFLQLVQNYANERKMRLEAEAEVKRLEEDNTYMNEVLLAKGLVLTEDIAKAHRLSAKQVNDILSREGIIFKRGTDRLWKLYQKYLDWGQTEVKISRSGYTYRQLKWTEEGAKNVSFILQSYGHRPISGNYPDAGYQLRFDF